MLYSRCHQGVSILEPGNADVSSTRTSFDIFGHLVYLSDLFPSLSLELFAILCFSDVFQRCAEQLMMRLQRFNKLITYYYRYIWFVGGNNKDVGLE